MMSTPSSIWSSNGHFLALSTTLRDSVPNWTLEPLDTSESGILSYETRLIFELVNFVIVCGVVSLFGMIANVVNIIVFSKQGFKDSINISLLGLALADLMCVTTMFWNSICFNPLFVHAGLPFDTVDLMYLSGGWPHSCFNRVTSFITAFITLERCLCILHPLKIKTILTPGRTKVIIVSIFVVMIILFSPFYYANRLEWIFHPDLNRTLLTLTFSHNRAEIETPTFYIHSVAFSIISLVTVIVCTVLLVIRLNQKSRWRQTTVAQNKANPNTASLKDKKVVKMVTFISSIFIICFVPATIIFFMMAYESEFNFKGKYRHSFFSVWSVAFALETFSSSVNIFIYFRMSSKFRQTFLHIFCGVTDSKLSR